MSSARMYTQSNSPDKSATVLGATKQPGRVSLSIPSTSNRVPTRFLTVDRTRFLRANIYAPLPEPVVTIFTILRKMIMQYVSLETTVIRRCAIIYCICLPVTARCSNDTPEPHQGQLAEPADDGLTARPIPNQIKKRRIYKASEWALRSRSWTPVELDQWRVTRLDEQGAREFNVVTRHYQIDSIKTDVRTGSGSASTPVGDFKTLCRSWRD